MTSFFPKGKNILVHWLDFSQMYNNPFKSLIQVFLPVLVMDQKKAINLQG